MKPLAERMLTDQLSELGCQLTGRAEGEFSFDVLFQAREPQLLQPGDLGLRKGSERKSASGGPRQSASAWSSVRAASAGALAMRASRPSEISCSNCLTSSSAAKIRSS